MLTPKEYLTLHTTARLLSDIGLFETLTPAAFVCLLGFACNDQPTDSLNRIARRLKWSKRRTRRYLQELAQVGLVEGVQSKPPTSGGIAPVRYRLTRPLKPRVNKQQTQTPSSCYINKQTTQEGLVRGESLTDQLKQVGVSDKTIPLLLSKYPPERIARQLRFLPYRNAQNPAGLLVGAIRGDWSPPVITRQVSSASRSGASCVGHAKSQAEHPSQKKANETQEKLARIKAERAKQKLRQEKLCALEKQLSPKEKNALHRDAEKRVRTSLRRAWPLQKPIPKSLLDAQYYRLIEMRFDKEK